MINIINDFLLGIFSSLSFHKTLYTILTANNKLFKNIYILTKYNLIILLFFLLTRYTYYGLIDCEFINNYLFYPIFFEYITYIIISIIEIGINIHSNIYHTIHYIGISNVISRQGKSNNLFEMIVIILIYQSTIFAYYKLINFLLIIHFYYLTILLDLIILSFYHSFYFYSNYWQQHNVSINTQIYIYETYWPYYLGYGFVASVLYIMSNNVFIHTLYNLYIINAIILSQMSVKIPHKNYTKKYPKINLQIMKSTELVLMVINKVVNYFVK